MDSTGLKIHRVSDWPEAKHCNGKTRKFWRKLHIGYDPGSGEIVASLLTTEHVGDETALPSLISRIAGKVVRFLADGAYDGTGVSNCLHKAFGAEVEVIIPPPKTAVLGLNEQRDAHVEKIAAKDRMAWQSATGYNDRDLAEAQIGCYKTVIDPALKSRKMERQTTETHIATKFLNRMTHLGRPVFERVA